MNPRSQALQALREKREQQRKWRTQLLTRLKALRYQGDDLERVGREWRLILHLDECFKSVRRADVEVHKVTFTLKTTARRCRAGSYCPKCFGPDQVSKRRKRDGEQLNEAAVRLGAEQFFVLEAAYPSLALLPSGKQLTNWLGRTGGRFRPLVTGGSWFAELDVAQTRVVGGCAPLATTGGRGRSGTQGRTPRKDAGDDDRPGAYLVVLVVLGKGASCDRERLKGKFPQAEVREYSTFAPAWEDLLRTWSGRQFSLSPDELAPVLLSLKGRTPQRMTTVIGPGLRGVTEEKPKSPVEPDAAAWVKLGEATSAKPKEWVVEDFRQRVLAVSGSVPARKVDSLVQRFSDWLDEAIYRKPAWMDRSPETKEGSTVGAEREEHVKRDELRNELKQALDPVHAKLDAIQRLLEQRNRGEISAEEFELRSRTVLDSRKVQ